MSTSSHWFIVWVPSGYHEKNQRSKSRTELTQVDRSLSQSEDEGRPGSCVGQKDTREEKEVQSEKTTNFVVTKISEENSIFGKLPAIIKDQNLPDLELQTVAVETPGNETINAISMPQNSTLGEDSEHETTVHSKPFLDWEPTEDIAKNVILSRNISSLHIIQSTDKTQTQISFCVPFEDVENLLLDLQNLGIGHTDNTSVSVIPASIHHSLDQGSDKHEEDVQEAKLDKFYSTIKSRLLVSEVIARIKSGSEFSFDFLLLLVLAGMISFMGLLENSSVVLVASMLVSPLMGPILAGIFGGAIQDSKLTWSGIRHEVYALFICIFIGFLFGLMICPWAEAYGVSQWPTQEMISRGELRALWVGILIAVPSGAGVALSVLGGNAGSLVGVAISASLLPPAVNAGLFWALSVVLVITGPESHALFYGFGQETNPETNITISLYKPRYSEHLPLESFYLGLTSLALTLINILCIIVTGILILKLKEVTPEKIPQKFSHFWREDIKTHRNYNRKIRKEDDHGLLTELNNGMSDVTTKEPEETIELEGTFLHSIFERAAIDKDFINIRQWVAMPNAAMPKDQGHRSPRIIQQVSSQEGAYQPLMSPNSQLAHVPNFTFPPNTGPHTHKRNTGLLPRDNYQTINTMGTFLDVPLFLQQEMLRSQEIRKRLGEGEFKPTKF